MSDEHQQSNEPAKAVQETGFHFLLGFPLVLIVLLGIQFLALTTIGEMFIIVSIFLYVITVIMIITAHRAGYRRFAAGAIISTSLAFLLSAACFGILYVAFASS